MAVNLNQGLSWHRARFRWLGLSLQSLFLVYLKLHEMDSVRTFDSATTLTVCDGYDVTKQEHYFKKRCNRCDCFHKMCTFRVWQVLLLLFIVAVITAGLALVIAMMETGKIATKHSAITETESPDDKGKQIEFSCLEADAHRVQLSQNILRFSSYNHYFPKHEQPLA